MAAVAAESRYYFLFMNLQGMLESVPAIRPKIVESARISSSRSARRACFSTLRESWGTWDWFFIIIYFIVASVIPQTPTALQSNCPRAYQSSILSPRPTSCNNKVETLNECLFLTGGCRCASFYIRSQRMRTDLLLLIILNSAVWPHFLLIPFRAAIV